MDRILEIGETVNIQAVAGRLLHQPVGPLYFLGVAEKIAQVYIHGRQTGVGDHLQMLIGVAVTTHTGVDGTEGETHLAGAVALFNDRRLVQIQGIL